MWEPGVYGWTISIHAPRVGSDLFWVLKRYLPSYFYPRSPRGERLYALVVKAMNRLISIHAPRVGSDTAIKRVCRGEGDFYPRSPRGERLFILLQI